MSTISNTQNNSARNERIVFKNLWWAGLVGGIAGAIGNVIVFLIAKYLFGLPLLIPLQGPGSPLEPLPVFMVIVATLASAVGATILLALLGKFAPRPILVFQIISVVFLLVSFGAPFSLPVDLGTKLALNAMHVVAAIAIVGVLTTLGRAK